ncbi:hypothetical protein GCM10011497_19470 [Elstera cyanobacteriorum]|nr:transposase [Elstera cyanobacteriorum]GFZ90096.1 hypothetical protein GCM10011497_19470 [Elstera cyanobacteriorum]
MKRSRFSEEQIIGILKEQEAGAVTADVCRRHGISNATFYKWKAKYGSLEVSEARRLKALEDENARLKNLLAESMQNGYSESLAYADLRLNGRMRDELLNETLFTSIPQARAVIAAWVADDNIVQPHSALGYQTPAAHAAKLKAIGPVSPPLPGLSGTPCMGVRFTLA